MFIVKMKTYNGVGPYNQPITYPVDIIATKDKKLAEHIMNVLNSHIVFCMDMYASRHVEYENVALNGIFKHDTEKLCKDLTAGDKVTLRGAKKIINAIETLLGTYSVFLNWGLFFVDTVETIG